MKKTIPFLAGVCLLFLALVLFYSCRKEIDLRSDLKNGNAELNACIITRMDYPTTDRDPPYYYQSTFTYNAKGDPLFVTPTFIGTGSPQWAFYYDKKGRLITFAGIYSNGGFEFWHNYFYDRFDRIVGDSLYHFGDIGQRGKAEGKGFSRISYDPLNRITEEKITFINTRFNTADSSVAHYAYNAAGNFSFNYIIDSMADNKFNFVLTNKVWRFISRDYSINNHQKETSYNHYGFPTLFTNLVMVDRALELFVPGYSTGGVKIEYDCSGAHGAVHQ